MACGCRLEGPAAEVAQWLRSPDLDRAVGPYCKADLLRGLNKEVLLTEDASVEGRCSEAFAAVKRFEESHKVAAQVGLDGSQLLCLRPLMVVAALSEAFDGHSCCVWGPSHGSQLFFLKPMLVAAVLSGVCVASVRLASS